MRSFTFGQFDRTAYQSTIIVAILLGFLTTCVCAESNTTAKPSHADIIRSAAAEGKIAYRLTTPEEVKVLLGQPARQEEEDEGELLVLEYPDVELKFLRLGSRSFSGPCVLYWVIAGGSEVDVGQERQIVLRDENDLVKLGEFWGFVNVSLVNVDLSGRRDYLETMPFDSRTKWPEPNKMPDGFNPARLLEEGKTPGLGVQDLHKRGIDGRGVAIAILDQPLLKNHQEYAGKLARYEGIDVEGMNPKMHGPPIVSIAVGEHCGVAPAASVYYYAMRATSLPDNKIYCDIIDGIIESNRGASGSGRIRVVSISSGVFAHQANFHRWKATLTKANKNGILVVTCDPAFLKYGTLERIPDKDADDPSGYRAGKFSSEDNVLRVPAGNRTTASHVAPYVYTYWRAGGMSWAAPYLAGLAALAFQVNPEIEPKTIVELWIKTAVHTDAGSVANPPGFIEAVRKCRNITNRK